ncbi:MAG: adenine deaminase [Chitinophagaceae bacterium]|nr:adenine deaminase [Chitinophagaceae bacterium]
MPEFTISGLLTDVFNQQIYPAQIHIREQKIVSIQQIDQSLLISKNYIIPGFIDSHVHIESSMLIPSEFARIAVTHGTVATVSDPHEIANVCGIDGVYYMIGNGKTVPFKFYFGAPSCVPATIFETAGAAINVAQVELLLQNEEVKYLSEMMNFPGVLSKDADVMRKIAAAHKMDKPVDGHAPGLTGDEAKQYIQAGISTDHECFTAEEALGKLGHGMKIIIREGSAAKNFDALIDLLNEHPDMMMFCSDDKHPDSLVKGHINQLCARAVAKGIDVFKILKAACVNPVFHYKLDVGLLRVGDPADFLIVENLTEFKVFQTYIEGQLVAEAGQSKIITSGDRQANKPTPINHFNCSKKSEKDFEVMFPSPAPTIHEKPMPVIEVIDGQLITNKVYVWPKIVNGKIVSDPQNDILKIVVVNRYAASVSNIASGFIKNVGLKQGALASSVAHDSHNIVAVGVDDASLCKAVNLIIAGKGGISCVGDTAEMLVQLPVAGLMSDEDGYMVAESYTAIDSMAKALGSTLSAPFMSLSFMALLVIPHLKLSDLGLFDGDSFQFIES